MQTDAYAHALMRLIEEGAKPAEAVKKLHTLLEREGRTALMPAVGRAFERLAAKKAARERSVLTVAHAKDEAKARKESGAKDADVAIDATIIGGWRLEAEETLQDASWKNHLLNIYQNVTKA
jgi:F0F1-type ATP synthase delta subunit